MLYFRVTKLPVIFYLAFAKIIDYNVIQLSSREYEAMVLKNRVFTAYYCKLTSFTNGNTMTVHQHAVLTHIFARRLAISFVQLSDFSIATSITQAFVHCVSKDAISR